MLRLEVLDKSDRVISVHQLGEGLTLLGQSPGAHVHLAGRGIGALHVAIKNGAKPIVMDLGGPTRMLVNGKEALEHEINFSDANNAAILDIGSRRVRIARNPLGLAEIRTQAWSPVIDRRASAKVGALTIRTRLYVKGRPEEVVNTQKFFQLNENYGVPAPFTTVWHKGKETFVQLPAEWLRLGGRLQLGQDKIGKLEDWSTPTRLERDTIYRVFAGPYVLEILVTSGNLVIGLPRADFFPKELRKPFAISTAAVLLVFALWMVIFGRPETKVEEPYTVYARIQNIPVEKLPEPEQTAASQLPQAGGGAGSEAKQVSAPVVGTAPAATPSKLAQALTGGLKNLVGNMLSQAKVNNTVVAESGVGQAAAAGAPGPQVGKLAAVGAGTSGIAGASNLGKLSIAGSGKGFSGGTGVGLGAGAGNGVGNGVGNGIGRGGFRLVEEESIVDGGLDKSVIAAVIANNLSQIKYCYERQLVAEPDLFGKVVATWFINAAGTVEAATVKQTTLNSSPVEQCMLSKISGWKFPQPKNGTRVTVTYPFLFKSTK